MEGWTFAAALVAAIVGVLTLLYTTVVTLRQQSFTRLEAAFQHLRDENPLFVRRGLSILKGLVKSRWVGQDDTEAAEEALRDYTESLEAKLTVPIPGGAK